MAGSAEMGGFGSGVAQTLTEIIPDRLIIDHADPRQTVV
jgi:hypothetical protein